MHNYNRPRCSIKTNINNDVNKKEMELPLPDDSDDFIDIEKVMNLQYMHHINKN